MQNLDLDQIKEGLPGISPIFGSFLSEASLVCLDSQCHKCGVGLAIYGAYEDKYSLIWTDQITEQIKATVLTI
ncbi:MAG: hypothetical protein HY738_00435 [Bacteroidia bacterium]|nr:hypothetical protein [Bacteroidia bacterium]